MHFRSPLIMSWIANETLDIVADSQWQKWGLKYVMYTPGGPVWTSDEYAYTEQWDNSDMVSIS